MPLSLPLPLPQTSLRTMLKAKGLRSVVEVDGVEPTNTPLRNQLFTLSGKRGVYPQVFIKSTEGAYEFVGELGDIVSMNDTDTLPMEILEQNPTIPTFNRVFKDFLP